MSEHDEDTADPALPQAVQELIAQEQMRAVDPDWHTVARLASRALELGRAQAPAAAWHPIETAPKDRTVIGERLRTLAADWSAADGYAPSCIEEAADALSTASPAPACASCAEQVKARGAVEAHLRETIQAKDAEIAKLRSALKEMTDDLEARWDMKDSSTNPGIRHCVEQARAALTGQGEP